MQKGQQTKLKDITGRIICIGDIVQWDDPEGIRIAIVIYKKFPKNNYEILSGRKEIGFKCIGNSIFPNHAVGHIFNLSNFMYKETENYLKIIGSKVKL